MPGYYLVCPVDATVSVDANERPRCRDDLGNDAWELHHTDSLSTFPDLSVSDAEQIGQAVMLMCAIAWVWVKLRSVT